MQACILYIVYLCAINKSLNLRTRHMHHVPNAHTSIEPIFAQTVCDNIQLLDCIYRMAIKSRMWIFYGYYSYSWIRISNKCQERCVDDDLQLSTIKRTQNDLDLLRWQAGKHLIDPDTIIFKCMF